MGFSLTLTFRGKSSKPNAKNGSGSLVSQLTDNRYRWNFFSLMPLPLLSCHNQVPPVRSCCWGSQYNPLSQSILSSWNPQRDLEPPRWCWVGSGSPVPSYSTLS